MFLEYNILGGHFGGKLEFETSTLDSLIPPNDILDTKVIVLLALEPDLISVFGFALVTRANA